MKLCLLAAIFSASVCVAETSLVWKWDAAGRSVPTALAAGQANASTVDWMYWADCSATGIAPRGAVLIVR